MYGQSESDGAQVTQCLILLSSHIRGPRWVAHATPTFPSYILDPMSMSSTGFLLVLLVAACNQIIPSHAHKPLAPLVSRAGSLSEETRLHDNSAGLAKWLWDNVNDLKEKSLTTRFIAGVKDGTLSPDFYGIYYVQDAVWVAKVANLWQALAEKTLPPEFQDLHTHAQQMAKSYGTYAKAMFEPWFILSNFSSDSYGVKLGPDAQYYVDFIKNSRKDGDVYMLFATYACLKLWPYFANHSATPPPPSNCTNVYDTWIEENTGESRSLFRQEKLINSYSTYVNRTKALEMFRQAMLCEINFFNQTHSTQTNSKAAFATLG